MQSPGLIAALLAESLLVLGGLVVLVRVLRRRGENLASAPGAWNAPLPDFLVFALCVIGGLLLGSSAGGALGRALSLHGTGAAAVGGALAQGGMLLGALGYFRFFPQERFPGPLTIPGMFRAGGATFLAALPLLVLTSIAWRALLQALGLPAERQALVDLFQQAESGPMLGLLIVIAVALAPVTEEIVFRAGLFRYVRTRFPRPIALMAPALLFAALHANLSSFAPLMILAVVFSLAYERTGAIAVPIIAHSLFNLNTVVLILSGAVDLA